MTRLSGLPGYAYLIEAGRTGDMWQKVGVAAGRDRVEQHRGWRPVVITVRPGYRLADPRGDIETPVLASVWRGGERRPTAAQPHCPDCGAPMPGLPAAGHGEAWHVPCRGPRRELFLELVERARAEHGYPDNSVTRFIDRELLPHSLQSSNGTLVHVGEYPQLPKRDEYTVHIATSFYTKGVPADEVLHRLDTAALQEPNLIKFLLTAFPDAVRKMDGSALRKASGSGGMNHAHEVQARLDQMARVPGITVAFINDRTSGILHAFADLKLRT